MPRSLWICHCKIEMSAPVRETSVLHLLQQVVNSPDKWNVSCVSSLGGFRGRQRLLFLRGSNAGHDASRRAGLLSRRSTLPCCASHSGAGLHDSAQTSWFWSPSSPTCSPWERCPSNAWWNRRGCHSFRQPQSLATNKQHDYACLKFATRASLCSIGQIVSDSSEAVFPQSCKQNFLHDTNTNIRIFSTHGRIFCLFLDRSSSNPFFFVLILFR